MAKVDPDKYTQADERAIRRLIKRHTAKRDWLMVKMLFADLGRLFEAQERGER